MNSIQERVNDQYKYAVSKYGDHILGVFLYGSQNYNMHTEDSDIDTKAIYIPTLDEIAAGVAPISKELSYGNRGEHIEVKDIRLMCQMWKKQNMNFLEILYTKFFVLNPKYADIFNQTFILYRSNISAYNIHQMIQSTIGQIKSTMKQAMAETTDPAAVGKKIANCFRLCFFCNDFLENNLTHYQDAMYISDEGTRQTLLHLKRQSFFERETIVTYAHLISGLCNNLEKQANEFDVNQDNKHLVDAIFTSGTRRLICKISNLQPILYF